MQPRTLPPTDDSESTGGSDESPLPEIDFYDLDSPTDPAGACSIQWIIETSTDMDTITTAVKMVPEVEWPDAVDVTFMLDRLTSQLHAYFGSPWQLTPYSQERVRTCLKALFHLYAERGLTGPLAILNHNILGDYHHLDAMPNQQNFYLISCVIERPYNLDITSLLFSDRTWMAHILTHQLHDGNQPPNIHPFVCEFIDKCLQDPRSPPRLVADCLLLAGLRLRRRYLAKIDKR
jgi:hypothetical protein